MTKFKTVLLAATALTLMGGAAMAQQNVSSVSQGADNSVAAVTQSGGFGTVGLNQATGNGNSAILTQGGTGNWIGDTNVTDTDEGPVIQNGNNNVMSIDQDGWENDVNIAGQSGNSNTLQITQTGDKGVSGINNTIEVRQFSGFVGPASGQIAILAQDATDSDMDVSQATMPGSVGNVVQSSQTGTTQTLDAEQAFGANTLHSNQFGEGNTIVMGQANSAAGSPGNTNGAFLIQGGSDNLIDGLQQGAALTLVVDQSTATDSIATSTQGGADNSAEITQTGEFQIASVAQTGSGNGATTFQFGEFQTSTIIQTGDDNTALIEQFGDNNLSYLLQGGDGNQAFVNQDDSGNVSTVEQTGDANVATILQGLGAAGAAAGGNSSAVVQSGTGNVVTVAQN